MKYIVHKRFKDKAICGDVNLPAMTICESDGLVIKHDENDICFVKSENAHQYFSINEDGMGIERGKLIQIIQKTLAKRDNNYQKRWDKIWNDKVCQYYKRDDYSDYWLWSHDFFNANISDLRYIAKLIDIKL